MTLVLEDTDIDTHGIRLSRVAESLQSHLEPATESATQTSTAAEMTAAAAELHAEETAAVAAAALKVEA